MTTTVEATHETPPPRLQLRTWREAEEYFKQHLTPSQYGPKGQPIYNMEDIEALNVGLPEEFWPESNE